MLFEYASHYKQNIDQIHALEGMVSQAANGASGVQRGNYQIFEQFLAHSNAKVHLNTTVCSVVWLYTLGIVLC